MHGVFVAVCGLSSCGKRGLLSSVGQGLLLVAASLVAKHGLWDTGLVAPRLVGSSRIGDRTCVLCIPRQILNHWPTWETEDSVVLNPHK